MREFLANSNADWEIIRSRAQSSPKPQDKKKAEELEWWAWRQMPTESKTLAVEHGIFSGGGSKVGEHRWRFCRKKSGEPLFDTGWMSANGAKNSFLRAFKQQTVLDAVASNGGILTHTLELQIDEAMNALGKEAAGV